MLEISKDQILDRLKPLLDDVGFDGVRWPSQAVQSQYTGASGDLLLARTVDFALFLASTFPNVAQRKTKGLDYGVGFGRIASVVNSIFPLTSLDCVDAWPASVELARSTGLTSSVKLVGAILSEHDLRESEYDYCYAYSVFTHLSKRAFLNNLEKLAASLRSNGKLIFTVRSPRFIEFLDRNGKLRAEERRIEDDGFWFGNRQNDDYGDTVVTEEWLLSATENLGPLIIQGALPSEPLQVVVSLTKA